MKPKLNTHIIRCSIIIIGLFYILPLTAQTIDRQVVAGAGATLSEGAYRLDFTLGEMTTTTLSHGDQLSQGFQQLWAVITAVDEQTADKFDVSIYPNPTFGIFTIASDQQLQYSIFDFTGKQIMTGEKQGGATEINIGDVQAELFLLVLRDRKGSKVTYKVEVVK